MKDKKYLIQVSCHTFHEPRLYASEYRSMDWVTQNFGEWNSDTILVLTRKGEPVAKYIHTPEGNKYFNAVI